VTNTDKAIGKYPVGQSPSFKKENFHFFEDTKNGPIITATTKTSHRILRQLRKLYNMLCLTLA